MGWPYRFLDLTDAQKQERRELLDKYARVAQTSAFVLLLAIQCLYFLSWLSRRRRDGVTPDSPRRKESFAHQTGLIRVKILWRKLSWWCGERVEVGDFYLGLRGEVLFAVIWLVWLLVLCVLETGEDYLHLTKRFGIIAASQLPMHYFLAIKSPYWPLRIPVQRSHETSNSIHQLLGRLILILLYFHATFYLNFYIQSGLLSSKIKELYVICGILAISCLSILGTTALAPIRTWNYRVFYTVHVVVAAAILPILFFHVSHIRTYLYESGVIYAVNAILHVLKSKKVTGSLKLIPNTNLIEIDIPLTGSRGEGKLRRWQPGQHAYLSLVGHSVSQVIRRNPFSISSIPSTDVQLRFVARVLEGNTTILAKEANSVKSNQHFKVEGPYGASDHSQSLLEYDRVLFVGGGVGGTFIVPLYRQLLADLSPSRGSYRRQKVTFIWVARQMADVAWAVPGNFADRQGFAERLTVHLTGASAGSSTTANGNFMHGENNHKDQAYGETEEAIELEERKNLLSGESSDIMENGSGGLVVRSGRPELKEIVDNTLSHGTSERVAVFVCGPKSLGRSLRRELRKWVARGRDIFYWEEEFSL